MRYRPDIDGLRAIAVAIVVLFHAGFATFQGGFVGVDVFFVISGFLITGLIRAELEEGRFSIRRFYERRVRRIFPALFATLAVVMLAAWFLLPAPEFIEAAQAAAAAGASVSNILFALRTDYFGAPAEAQPLLHTWSLGVEEQFYLVFPALMWLAWRCWRPGVRALVWLATGLSFVACVLTLPRMPAATFYLAPFRAWELGLGALAATGALRAPTSRWGAELMVAGGLALVLGSALLISEFDPFPGFFALPPCLGALLAILGGEKIQGRCSRLLAWRPVVFVGLVSYSLYLWHWPILVFARAQRLRPLETGEALVAVALAFLLAVASWRWVEMPFRRPATPDRPSLLPRPLRAAGFAIVVAVLFGFAAEPMQELLRPGAAANKVVIRGREDYRDRECFLFTDQSFADWKGAARCAIGGAAKPRALLWGDSFAAHYAGGLDSLAGRMPSAIVELSSQSCPPVFGARVAWAPACEAFNQNIPRVLDSGDYDAVILAARWERYWGRQVDAAALERTIAALHARGLAVVLVGQGPSFGFHDPALYVARSGGDWAPLSRHVGRINRELRAVRGADAFFDPTQALCHAGRCELRRDARFLYWDGGHYARAGSDIAARELVLALRLARTRHTAASAGGEPRGNAD
jgi:peptidoglycan/LPS O-acetylase OafA/YrhL